MLLFCKGQYGGKICADSERKKRLSEVFFDGRFRPQPFLRNWKILPQNRIGQFLRQRIEKADFPHFAVGRNFFQPVYHRQINLSISLIMIAVQRPVYGIVAQRLQFKVYRSRFLKKFPFCRFQRRFPFLNPSAGMLPGGSFFVSAENPFFLKYGKNIR